jgi:hypothetical protein
MDSTSVCGLLEALWTGEGQVRDTEIGDRRVKYVEYGGYGLGITSDNLITVMSITKDGTTPLFTMKMLDVEYNLADAICLASMGVSKEGIYVFL